MRREECQLDAFRLFTVLPFGELTLDTLNTEAPGQDPRSLSVEPLEREARVEHGGREDLWVSLNDWEESSGVLVRCFGETDLVCERFRARKKVSVDSWARREERVGGRQEGREREGGLNEPNIEVPFNSLSSTSDQNIGVSKFVGRISIIA